MRFLIDENLPVSMGDIFIEQGFEAEAVADLPALRGKSDEVIFDYAAKNNAIIVSQDLDFTNPLCFDLRRVRGLILLRFPNEISMAKMRSEVARLIESLREQDFYKLIIIEPGSLRTREL